MVQAAAAVSTIIFTVELDSIVIINQARYFAMANFDECVGELLSSALRRAIHP